MEVNSNSMLRIQRRRAAMRQDELAWLLGLQAPSAISRYENGSRVPDLITAVACAILFKTSVEDLFSEIERETRHTIQLRARALAKRLTAGPVDARVEFLVRHLEALREPGVAQS